MSYAGDSGLSGSEAGSTALGSTFGGGGALGGDAELTSYRRASTLGKGWILARAGTFAAAHAMRKGLETSRALVQALLVIETLQLLSLLLYAPAGFRWAPSLGWLESLSAAVNFGTIVVESGGLAWPLALGCLCFAYALVLGVALLGGSLITQSSQFLFLCAPLRSLITLSASALLLPTSAAFVAVVECKAFVPTECGSGAQWLLSAATLVAWAALLAVQVLFALLVFDPSPLSGDALARPHGRAWALSIVLKTACGAAFALLADSEGAEILLVVTCGTCAVLLAANLVYLPHYSDAVTAGSAMQAAVVLAAGASAAAELLAGDDGRVGAAFLFAAGPLALALGATLVPLRIAQLRARPVASIRSAFLLEARVRVERRSRAAAYAGEFDAAGGALGGSRPAEPESERVHEDSLTDAERWGEWAVSQLAAASARNPTDPWTRLFAYHLLVHVAGDRDAGVGELIKAKEHRPPVEVHFTSYCADKDVSERDGDGAQAASFLEYEGHLQRARQHTQRSLQLQLKVWIEYDAKVPDLDRVFTVARRLARESALAQRHFEAALRITPKSVMALRKFASFLLHVRNEQATAQELLAKADVLEDEEANAGDAGSSSAFQEALVGSTVMHTGEELDALDDRNAAIVIEGDGPHLGSMVSVNAAATRITGFKQAALLHKSVNLLIPAPLSSMHDGFVRAYTRTRKGKYMKTTRPVFIGTRGGYMRPAVLSLREVMSGGASGGGGAGSAAHGGSAAGGSGVRYLAVVAAVKTRADYVMIDGPGYVCSATEGGAVLLGLTLDALTARRVRLQSLLPGLYVAGVTTPSTGTFDLPPPAGVEGAGALTVTVFAMRGGTSAVTVVQLSASTTAAGTPFGAATGAAAAAGADSPRSWADRDSVQLGSVAEGGVELQERSSLLQHDQRLAGPARGSGAGPDTASLSQVGGARVSGSILDDDASIGSDGDGDEDDKLLSPDGSPGAAARRRSDRPLAPAVRPAATGASPAARTAMPPIVATVGGAVAASPPSSQEGSQPPSARSAAAAAPGAAGVAPQTHAARAAHPLHVHMPGPSSRSHTPADAAGPEADARLLCDTQRRGDRGHDALLQPLAGSGGAAAATGSAARRASSASGAAHGGRVPSHRSKQRGGSILKRGRVDGDDEAEVVVQGEVEADDKEASAEVSSLVPLPGEGAGIGGAGRGRDSEGATDEERGALLESEPSHVRVRREDPGAVEETASRHSRSHASGSRGSSGTSSIGLRGMQTTVKRMNAALDPELLRLQRLVALLLMLFTALAFAVVGVADVYLTEWSDDVGQIRVSEKRMLYCATLGLDVATMQRAVEGLKTANESAFASERIKHVVQELLVEHHTLMAEASPESMTTLLPIQVMLGGNLTLDPVNEWTAVIDAASRAALIRQYPTFAFNESSEVTGEDRSTKEELQNNLIYIRTNMLTVLIPALRAATERYDQETIDAIEMVKAVLLISTLAALAPLLLSVAFAYMPAMIRNEERRRSILRIFLKIPSAVLQEQVVSCRQAIAEAVGDDEEEGIVDFEEHPQPAAAAGAAGGGGGDAKGGVGATTTAPGRQNAAHERSRKAFRLSKQRLVHTVARFSVGYFLAIGVFLFLLFYGDMQAEYARDIASDALFAGRRLSATRVSHLVVRDYAASMDEAAMLRLHGRAQAALDEVADMERRLMFGSQTRDTRGLISVTVGNNQRDLMLRDGCQGTWPDERFKADCPHFYNGIMSQGLHAALLTFLQHSRELMTLRQRQTRDYTLRSRGMRLFEQFDDFYLWNALYYSNTLYEQDAERHVDDTLWALWFTAIAYSATNLLLYMTLYRRLISNLNRDLVQARALLLLLPSDVVTQNASVRKFIAELSSEAAVV